MASGPEQFTFVRPSTEPKPGEPAPAEPRIKDKIQPFVEHSRLPYLLQETMPLRVGNRLYLFGGITPLQGVVQSTDSILVANLDDQGQLGTFTKVSDTHLVTPRHLGWATRLGDYVYVVGGFVGAKESSATTTVERARIAADGSLGAFELVSGVDLLSARGGFAYLNTGNWLYVTGGKPGSTGNSIGSTERAPVSPDGTVGTFEAATPTLGTPRWSMPGVRIGNYFYLLGGETIVGSSESQLRTIERSEVGADGTLGAFSTLPTQLAVARNRSGFVLLFDRIYLFGGYTGTGFLKQLEQGTIGTDDTLSDFKASADSTLVQGLENGITVAAGNSVYYIGGFNFSNQQGMNLVQRAPILVEVAQ